MSESLGYIVSGSLGEGFVMRISPHADLEQLKTGKFVSIAGIAQRFFSLITDLKLEISHPDILLFPPSENETLLKQALRTKDIYATAMLRPMLALSNTNKRGPVKTIPAHFSYVYEATKSDIAFIFGDERDASKKYFHVGFPLDMDAPICLDLEKLTERSNGIFGKTGTGKTFITRLVLSRIDRPK